MCLQSPQLLESSSSFPDLQFRSATQPTLCDPMDYSMPGFPVHHQFLKFTQTHVYWVGDAIQPSHPLLSHSPPAFNLPALGSFLMCQFFKSGGQSVGVSASASVLPMNIQSWFPLGLTGLISLQSKGLSSLLQHHGLKVPILRRSAMFCQNSSLWLIHLGWHGL